MCLEEGFVRVKIGETVTLAQHSSGSASFVVRRPPIMGTLGFPNVFVLEADDDFAVVYFCQSEFFFINIQAAAIIARESYLDDVSLHERVEQAKTKLSSYNRKFNMQSVYEECPAQFSLLEVSFVSEPLF